MMKTQLLKITFYAIIIAVNATTVFGQNPPNNACGTVLNFDGTDDYVALPLSVSVANTSEFTIEAWVHWDGTSTRTIYAETDTTSNNPIFSIIPLSAGGMEVTYRDASFTGLLQSPTNGSIPINTWTHLALVKTSSTNIKVYINGSLTDDLNFTSPNTWVVNSASIGVRRRLMNDSYFLGNMDEVRIWSIARTAAEISNTMNVSLLGTEPGLTAYYDFNDNTGSLTLADQVNSQDGILMNMDETTDWTWYDGNSVTTDTSFSATACERYTSPSGKIWTISGVYTDTIPNSALCHNIATIDVTILDVDSTVIQTGATLTANASGVSYQWINCANMTFINGATNQTFTASVNGDYAVIVTDNSCADTSACYAVTGLGMTINSFGSELVIFPNPTSGHFSIDLGAPYKTTKITLTNMTGKIIQTSLFTESRLININLEEPAGIYLMIIESENQKAVIRVAKE